MTWRTAGGRACSSRAVEHPIVRRLWTVDPGTAGPLEISRSAQLSTTVIVDADGMIGTIGQSDHWCAERIAVLRLGVELHPWASDPETVAVVTERLATLDDVSSGVSATVLRALGGLPSRRPDNVVLDLLGALAASPTRATIAELLAAWGGSGRTLRRRTSDQVGLPPDSVRRILRANRARRLVGFSDRPLAAAAIEAGYADQAHMTRQFTRLCGSTPDEWRRHVVAWTRSAAA